MSYDTPRTWGEARGAAGVSLEVQVVASRSSSGRKVEYTAASPARESGGVWMRVAHVSSDDRPPRTVSVGGGKIEVYSLASFRIRARPRAVEAGG